MSWSFGQRSQANLLTVHPDLRRVCYTALTRSPVDFGAIEGARTIERQRQLFELGHSRTMNSKHLPRGEPPYAHAVDLAPFVNGVLQWGPFELFEQVADAVRIAAIAEGVAITWGAAWRRDLRDYRSARQARLAYVAENRARKRAVFLDGPHFELMS